MANDQDGKANAITLGAGVDEYTRWADETFEGAAPTRVEPPTPSATYVIQKICRVVQVPPAAATPAAGAGESFLSLKIIDMEGSRIFHYVGRKPDDTSVLLYCSSDAPPETIEVLPQDDSRPEPGASVTFADGTVIRPATAYDPLPDKDSVAFGGTFNLTEAKVLSDAATWMFAGHDITKMDPQHLQDTLALSLRVFRYPPSDSKEYHVSAGLPMPNGVECYPDVSGSGSVEDREVNSESSYQKSWAWGVGVKANVEGFGGFANKDFRGKMDASLSHTAGVSITRQINVRCIVVLDVPRVALDEKFTGEVESLCDQVTDAALERLVKNFGTHFARAAIYGRMEVSEYRYSREGRKSLMGSGETVSAEINTPVGGASGHESSDTSSSTGVDAKYGTRYSWSIGDASNPAPIAADLRPISDLINPVLFPDVDEGALARCRQALATYMVQRARQFEGFSDKSLLPLPLLEVEVVEVSKLSQCLSPNRQPVALEIRLEVPAGPGTKVLPASGSPQKWSWQSKESQGIPDPLPVNLKSRYVVQSGAPGDAINVRATITGKWQDPEDRDVKDLVVVPLAFSQFGIKESTVEGKVSRDMGGIRFTLRIRNCGGDLGA